MNEIVDNLKELLSKHRQQISQINDKITQLEDVPLVKSLVGKYFKYESGYSPIEKWWIYYRIKNFKDLSLIIDYFCKDTKGEFSFHFSKEEYRYRFESPALIPISKKEYYAAYNKLVKELARKGKK